MSAKHTDGPWSVHPNPDPKLGFLIGAPGEPRGRHIANVFEEGDALLMASSPEMLIELIDAIAMLEHYVEGRPRNWDGSTEGQARVTIKKARRLLARIKGGPA